MLIVNRVHDASDTASRKVTKSELRTRESQAFFVELLVAQAGC